MVPGTPAPSSIGAPMTDRTLVWPLRLSDPSIPAPVVMRVGSWASGLAMSGGAREPTSSIGTFQRLRKFDQS
jgi:hypothetical protein